MTKSLPATGCNPLINVAPTLRWWSAGATHHWAREGLQGKVVTLAHADILPRLPRIPMSKDDPGVIPEPVLEGPR